MVTESLKKNNQIYLLTKYIKRVLWGIAVRMSYIQDAWCLKVKVNCLLQIPTYAQIIICAYVGIYNKQFVIKYAPYE